MLWFPSLSVPNASAFRFLEITVEPSAKTPRERLILAILQYRKDTAHPLPKVLLAALEYLDGLR